MLLLAILYGCREMLGSFFAFTFRSFFLIDYQNICIGEGVAKTP
jgi:hypothetical protein